MYRLVSFCFLLVVSFAANAQNSSSSVSAPIPANPNQEASKKFSTTVIISTSTNLEQNSSSQDSTGSSIELKPSVRITRKASLGVNLSAKTDHTTGDAKMLNTQILISRDPIQLDEDNSLKIAAQAILPTDKVAREASLNAGAGVIVGIEHRMALFKKESKFNYAANILKNSHEFDRDNNREANISHRLRNVVGIEIQLGKKISLSLDGYYQVGQTYEGVTRETFNASQSLNYELSENFAVGIEHTLEGKVFAADGSEWNANLYDSRKSEIGVSLMGTY